MNIFSMLMRSPCMRAVYGQLPSKVAFISFIFDVGYDHLRSIQNILSEKPYCAAFVCETTNIELFQDLELSDGFSKFSDAVDNLTLYELDQMSVFYYEQIKEFIAFLQI